jgi:hypothetical protein
MSTSPPKPPDASELERQRLALLVRGLTLLGSEVAFAGLFAYVMYETWDATAGTAPSISGPVQGAAGALAVALAAGYAGELGTAASAGISALSRATWRDLTTGELILFLGVFVYMAVGAACGITYLAHTEETPGLLKTVAVAFGGYVIAYIGAAYKQLGR